MRPYTLSRKKSRLSLTLQSKFYLLFPCSRLSKIAKTWCHGRFPGGDGRTRTGGILLAKQALYQLSYAPYARTGGPDWNRTSDLVLIRDAL